MLSIITIIFLLLIKNGIFRILDFSKIEIDPLTSNFVDDKGRERFFHGVNLVMKSFPYYYEDNQDFKLENDIMYMKKLGFNIVRLGVLWAGVSPKFGEINDTYIEKINEIIKIFQKHGIYVLVDAHQDLFSESFCGDGSPKINLGPKKLNSFPFPIPCTISYDPVTGFPNCDSCLKHFTWQLFYSCPDVQKSFDYLYENTAPYFLKNHFITFWKALANKFKDLPSVIGYNLYNEPFPGYIYKNLKLAIPFIANKRLFKFYEDVTAEIRKFDDNHMIFIEPVVYNLRYSGFPGPIGGKRYSNKTAVSYHFYTPINPSVESTISFWHENTKNVNIGRMLTEFWIGGLQVNNEEFFQTLSIADKYLHSWIAWEYSPSVNNKRKFENDFRRKIAKDRILNKENLSIKNNSRTYPFAVSGRTLEYKFDPISNIFYIKYEISHNRQSNDTILFYNQELHYPQGVHIDIKTTGVCKAKWNIDENFIIIEHNNDFCKFKDLIQAWIFPLQRNI